MEENGSADGVGRLRWVCCWGDFFCESDAAFSSCGAAIVVAVAVGAALALAEVKSNVAISFVSSPSSACECGAF